jgi:hypothetical protein
MELKPSVAPAPGPRARSGVGTGLLTLALPLTLALSGCSALLLKPAQIDRQHNPDCTSTAALPVMDMGATAGLLTTMVLSGVNDSGASAPDYFVVGFAAAIFLASGIYGVSNVKECIADKPDVWEPDAPPDPDSRPKKKKPPSRLVPEPGVMRSN